MLLDSLILPRCRDLFAGCDCAVCCFLLWCDCWKWQFALSVFAGAGVNMWIFVNFESYFLLFYLFFLSGDFSWLDRPWYSVTIENMCRCCYYKFSCDYRCKFVCLLPFHIVSLHTTSRHCDHISVFITLSMIWGDDKSEHAAAAAGACVWVCVCPSGFDRLICITYPGKNCPCPAVCFFFFLSSVFSRPLTLLTICTRPSPCLFWRIIWDIFALLNEKLLCASFSLFHLHFLKSQFHSKPLFLCLSLSPCQLPAYLPSGVYWPAPSLLLYLPIHSSIHPFIPPSGQSLPVLPGGCALADWHLASVQTASAWLTYLYCQPVGWLACSTLNVIQSLPAGMFVNVGGEV